MYEYSAQIVHVVDGDTVDLKVDLGFYTFIQDRFRLARINCPELSTSEGKEAAKYTLQYLGAEVTIKTTKNPKDKYGRYIADIYINGVCLNDALVENGHAVPYMT